MAINVDTLYIDFDGTIVNTVKAIVSLYNKDYRYYIDFEKIEWSDINTWEFEECKLAPTEYINSYFNTPRFFKNLEFMPWAKRIIAELRKHYRIKVVSMGDQPNLVGKGLWLNDHLTDIEFIGVDFKDHSNKAHIDMSDGVLIDDSYENLATSNAFENICFGDVYSWNEKWDGIRVYNWQELRKLLLEP